MIAGSVVVRLYLSLSVCVHVFFLFLFLLCIGLLYGPWLSETRK